MDQLRQQALPGGRLAMTAAGHRIELDDSSVTVDGAVRVLSPASMAMLQALSRRPGRVVTRGELLHALPGSAADPHAVDTAMLRLRKALGDRNIVMTVVKRGYRLRIDETPFAEGEPQLGT